MSQRLIAQLGEREQIDQVFLAGDKQLRPNRNGDLYLQVRLSDKSGAVHAVMWNANDSVYSGFNNGDFVHVEGNSQIYNGKLQIVIKQIDRADPGEVNEEDFLLVSIRNVDELAAELREMIRGMGEPHLVNLADIYLLDEALMAQFAAAPAGIKNHHAYSGGLLEHVVSLMHLVKVVAPLYDDVDDDLLLMGAFLHDLGKVRELTYERDFGYSDEGQLLGHIVVGVQMLDEKIAEVERLSNEKFPTELSLRLKHMVVSHHGEYEYGSPKLPMTVEAMVLHFLDNIDAKVHNFSQLIREDVNADSRWTIYHPHLGRKLFKPLKD